MSEPVDDTPDEAEEGSADGDDERTPLGRWIAISLAAIAVVAAAIAVLQTDASVNESNTARETTRTAVAALRAGVVEEAGIGLERDISAESGALLRQQAFVVRQSGDAADPLTGDQLRDILPEGSELPGARTEEELRRLSFESERLALRQNALAETRVTWNDRSTEYTTAIAVLAVALFLVGFSLVLRGPRRSVFYGLGLVVAIITVGWTVYLYTLPIPETAEEAIEATAQGTVASGEGDQQTAIERLDEAIAADDDYAAPYSRRAIARALRANPDLRTTGAVTGSDESFDAAIADARKALDLGGDRDFLALAFVAIATLYAGEYGDSVAAADEAIAINDQIPDIRLVKSAAEVGRGDDEAAVAALDAARDLISGSDPSERTRGLVAEYLTYLESVAHRAPERADLVAQLEQRIIGTETGFVLDREVSRSLPGQGSVDITGLRYENGRFRLRVTWEDLPPGTALTLIGFERPAPGNGWVQPRDLALFRTAGGDGTEVGSVRIERACTPVEVRVDVYLDGAFDKTVTGPGGTATC